MFGDKNWYASKAIWASILGAGVMFLAGLNIHFGWVDGIDVEKVSASAAILAPIVASLFLHLLSLYSRWTASKRIRVIGPVVILFAFALTACHYQITTLSEDKITRTSFDFGTNSQDNFSCAQTDPETGVQTVATNFGTSTQVDPGTTAAVKGIAIGAISAMAATKGPTTDQPDPNSDNTARAKSRQSLLGSGTGLAGCLGEHFQKGDK